MKIQVEAVSPVEKKVTIEIDPEYIGKVIGPGGKVIRGKKESIRLLLISLLSAGHALLLPWHAAMMQPLVVAVHVATHGRAGGCWAGSTVGG